MELLDRIFSFLDSVWIVVVSLLVVAYSVSFYRKYKQRLFPKYCRDCKFYKPHSEVPTHNVLSNQCTKLKNYIVSRDEITGESQLAMDLPCNLMRRGGTNNDFKSIWVEGKEINLLTHLVESKKICGQQARHYEEKKTNEK